MGCSYQIPGNDLTTTTHKFILKRLLLRHPNRDPAIFGPTFSGVV